ncbi:Wall-associated receptor kinase-like 1 [Prunus dulcis]|uniref:Wall-associated receptor kinase-like 1 n=1 Tax=Prunus dulcis TaxID=3755 RepID=A0A4Y1RAY7_PRUDU|nr:Wall-associated receptor kinase-like 1 [Prunus dulcis]
MTDHYDEKRKIGEGGYGLVYKGILPADKREGAPITDSLEFANEVILLSQINHKNVEKLLGCCLETQTPILVYEFISNGTLYDHLHGKDRKEQLSLESRLKIASGTAEALSYLHHSISNPIIHRDVKSMNVLLDKNYVAKVADFGASRLVLEDQNQLATLVQGTLGYLDPEYLHQSHILTDKSDVYSFGVVLAELLTGKKALIKKKNEAENLANVFVSAMKEGRLAEILDADVVKEEHDFEAIVEKVANLAKKCLALRGEERPPMMK